LPSDQAEQFAIRFQVAVDELRTEFTPPIIGIGQPAVAISFPPLPKLSKRVEELKQKAHGKAKARLPTSSELAEIEAGKRKRAATISKHMSGPLCSAPPCLEIYQPRKKRSTAKIQQRKTPVDGSQEVPVDLCALDTQERNWIDGYTGGRVAVDLTGSDSEAEVESQDIRKMIEEAAL
jgi:hypothetical protein